MSTPDSPVPAYTPLSTKATPSSVFSLKPGKDGEVEFTANRKIIRVTVYHSTETYKEGTYKTVTSIKGDIIPTNQEVLDQVLKDVVNDQTQPVLHSPKKAVKNVQTQVSKKKWWKFGRD